MQSGIESQSVIIREIDTVAEMRAAEDLQIEAR